VKFELMINRKTAKELGLSIPASLLATVDALIDQAVFPLLAQALRQDVCSSPVASDLDACFGVRWEEDTFRAMSESGGEPDSGPKPLLVDYQDDRAYAAASLDGRS
jgi:hypothetical protein